MKFFLAAAASFALAACTKPNPAVCCVSADDCSSIGVNETGRGCAIGLTCVDHACVEPTCTTSADCMGSTPVCADGTCVACDTQNACPMSEVCDTAGGACVGCLTDNDCTTADPVCNTSTNTCTTCKLDSECASNACASDGTCVPEDQVVYLDPAGTDSGSCNRAQPCHLLSFGVTRTATSRSHIVMAPGTYADLVVIDSTQTPAASVSIHGGGATYGPPGGTDSKVITLKDVPVTMENFTIIGNGSAGASLQTNNATCTLSHMRFQASGPIDAGTNLTILDSDLSGNNTAIFLFATSHLVLDRVVIHGGSNGILAGSAGASVDITNTIVYGTSGLAFDFTGASGTVRFSTIADAGADAGTGPQAMTCLGVAVQSSIIWTPNTTGRAPIDCTPTSSIVGPTAVAGATNVNPLFQNEAANDYHLGANSPARDMLDSGPPDDFEGDPRPQGPRFDIGADEAKQ